MSSDDPRTAAQTLLDTLWTRGLPQLKDRLALIERAAAASSLTAEARAEAAATAHKLAGSLGMFGYPGGTAAARQLEIEFGAGANSATLVPLSKRLRRELGL